MKTVSHFDIDGTVMVNFENYELDGPAKENTINKIVAQNILGRFVLPEHSNPLDFECIEECIRKQWTLDDSGKSTFDEYLSKAWYTSESAKKER